MKDKNKSIVSSNGIRIKGDIATFINYEKEKEIDAANKKLASLINKSHELLDDVMQFSKDVKQEQLTNKKEKTKIKKKKIKEINIVLSKHKSTPIGDTRRFSTYRAIEALVSYFKENNSDLNAVTESWIRHNITSNELLEYYKSKMQREVIGYKAVVYRMLNMSSVSDKERRHLRIETFKNKIYAYLNSKLEYPNSQIPSTRKEESSFEALKKKEWILDWNCVMFKRGSVVIYSRSDSGVKFKPTTVYARNSLESFNYLRKYLNDRLPPVRCSIVGDNLTVLDEINFNSAIQQFSMAARQGVIKTSGRGSGVSYAPTPMTFSQALSKAKQMTPEEFHKYKSKYIDYLVMEQSKNYKVIPCVERLAHANSDITEYAFMFSIECSSGRILIVHENVNPDRSTLLFLVNAEDFNRSIREIYDFLQGAEINKRSSLRDRSIEIHNAGIVSYRSINHDDVYSWKQTIGSYKRYR